MHLEGVCNSRGVSLLARKWSVILVWRIELCFFRRNSRWEALTAGRISSFAQLQKTQYPMHWGPRQQWTALLRDHAPPLSKICIRVSNNKSNLGLQGNFLRHDVLFFRVEQSFNTERIIVDAILVEISYDLIPKKTKIMQLCSDTIMLLTKAMTETILNGNGR